MSAAKQWINFTYLKWERLPLTTLMKNTFSVNVSILYFFQKPKQSSNVHNVTSKYVRTVIRITKRQWHAKIIRSGNKRMIWEKESSNRWLTMVSLNFVLSANHQHLNTKDAITWLAAQLLVKVKQIFAIFVRNN